ncbi:mitochondrial Rho GTPase 3 [Brassica napus]|uniref:mitochondrial Rho GTPase 3 n=1 Tax=Brassica napus TaxID=3708 RepID=UPI002079D19A|nr:mitochondrial Rho GTPase 3 [Brassica napus]
MIFKMMRMLGLGGSGSPKPVRIVVVGEKGTGKTSLIIAALNESSQPQPNIPPVLPYTTFPSEWFRDPIPATIIDTSSKPEDREKVVKEVKEADAIVLTFVVDIPETLDRLSEYWLPLFRQLEVRVPIIIAGCSVTNREYHNQSGMEIITTSIREQYPEIETCFDWSAHHIARKVFWYAQHAVTNPVGPIYDKETGSLKPRCVAALTRVYVLSTRDTDFILNEAGLNNIQAQCCYEPLTPSQSRGLIDFVQERSPLGVDENGITIEGFLFMNKYLVEQGRIRRVWNILRKFGYNNELRLADDMIPYSSFKRMSDQSVELSDEAIGFLRGVYKNLDEHSGNNLGPQMIGFVFQISPENPWSIAPYKDASEKTDDGGLSLEAFLSLWNLLTLIDPARSLECLICLCYPSSAVRITRRRAIDRKEQNSDRRVFQCFVFGPKNAGKSALLNRFIGRSVCSFNSVYVKICMSDYMNLRPYDDDNNNGSNEERYAVNMVDNDGVTGDVKKTLVLKEVQMQEDGFLPSNEALGACDVAIFLYDSSDESSWKRAIDLLVKVATTSEDAGLEFPCLMVAAKADLDSFPEAIQETTRVIVISCFLISNHQKVFVIINLNKYEFLQATRDIGIEAPIPISSKLGDLDNLFQKISTAAEHPHLGIPKIKSKKKRSRKLMKRSLMVVSSMFFLVICLCIFIIVFVDS